MLGYVMPPQQYPYSDKATIGKLDKLNQFLLHHFEDELKEFESYRAVSNRTFQQTDNALQNVSDDLSMLMQSMNTIMKMIEELDVRTERMRPNENRIIDLENNMSNVLARLEQLESKNTRNKRNRDK